MPVIFTHTQSHTHTHSNHPHSPEHTHVKHNTQLYNIKLQQFILRANHVNFNQHATDNHNHAPLIHTASQQTDNTLSHHKTDCATSISAMPIQILFSLLSFMSARMYTLTLSNMNLKIHLLPLCVTAVHTALEMTSERT